MDISKVFARVCCVNLNRRPDRWERFQRGLPSEWPFAPIERVNAIDGTRVSSPHWWRPTNGAWGCFRTHLRLIEDALNDGLDSILIFEDDALFSSDFAVRVRKFIQRVPDDWGMIYLGGQHLKTGCVLPRVINEQVCVPYNVNRTHAFALRGATMEAVYQHLSSDQWREGNHIDHHLGRFVEKRDPRYKVYCPRSWLVGQAGGNSDITAKQFSNRFWNTTQGVDLTKQRFLAVLGLHSSGSSALAGVLWSLGVYLGSELGGYYGNRPGDRCGYEDAELADICESLIPFPSLEALKDTEHESRLMRWIMQQRARAHQMKTIAGGKHPLLCGLGERLKEICGDRLRLIISDRDLGESIRSLQRRCPAIDPKRIESHQRWLWDGLNQLRQSVPASRQLVVRYEDLLRDPENEAHRLLQFLPLQNGNIACRIAKAAAPIQLYVHSQAQHTS